MLVCGCRDAGFDEKEHHYLEQQRTNQPLTGHGGMLDSHRSTLIVHRRQIPQGEKVGYAVLRAQGSLEEEVLELCGEQGCWAGEEV